MAHRANNSLLPTLRKPLLAGALVFFALFALPAIAQNIQGKVVGVTDGDTLTVLTADKALAKVRLTEIDAPEKAQPFGQAAKQALSDTCYNKTAVLVSAGRDRYGRTMARVQCDGLDANAEQVRRGLAWVYDKYVKDRSLYALQETAKHQKRGLWSDAKPIPPWEWRKAATTKPWTIRGTACKTRLKPLLPLA